MIQAVFIKEPEPGCYEIWVRSFAGESPAGPRLLRGKHLPEIEFTSFDKTNAESNARRLTAHLKEHNQLDVAEGHQNAL